MLEAWSNDESSAATEVPGFAGAGFVVDDDAAYDGYKGGGVVVECSIEVFLG